MKQTQIYFLMLLATLLIGCSSDPPAAPKDTPTAEEKPTAVEEASTAPPEGDKAAESTEQPAAAPGEKTAQPADAPADPESESAMGPSESELSNNYEPDPTAVRVAVLNTSGRARGAGLIAFLLEDYRKKYLERKIGKLIAVVNQSSISGVKLENSVISYRPGNLRAALIMASAIPGKQYVAPMILENTVKIAVDVEIRVGRELP